MWEKFTNGSMTSTQRRRCTRSRSSRTMCWRRCWPPRLLARAKDGCAIYNSAEMTLEEVLAAAPEDIRLGLFDQVAGLRLQWCTAAFARGLQLGLTLGVEQGQAPHYRSR